MKAVRADSKGRIVLGKESAGREFIVTPAKGGYQVRAVKTVTVPEGEAWLWEDAAALRSVLTGIEESKAGKGADLGSFAEFADVDLDEPETGH